MRRCSMIIEGLVDRSIFVSQVGGILFVNIIPALALSQFNAIIE